jgi:hypothetical protein
VPYSGCSPSLVELGFLMCTLSWQELEDKVSCQSHWILNSSHKGPASRTVGRQVWISSWVGNGTCMVWQLQCWASV